MQRSAPIDARHDHCPGRRPDKHTDGSANEYTGDGPFLRDEIGSSSHSRGTVGLSTRGRDTGDAQLFINLVNNPRLDFDYTIFGRVSGRSAAMLDEVLEGDRITDAWFERASARR